MSDSRERARPAHQRATAGSAAPTEPVHPRFSRTDRYATSCSALSALAQWELLGVVPEDIRLLLRGRTHPSRAEIIAQSPDPGSAVRHGQSVTLELALPSMADEYPERLFVSLTGAEGRAQMEAARRIFAPFDKEQLLARSRLRRWNAVFSGASRDASFARALYAMLGLEPASLERARQVFDEQGLQDWLRILPLLHRVTGDRTVSGALLSRFLGDPVEIRDGHAAGHDLSGATALTLAAPDHAPAGDDALDPPDAPGPNPAGAGHPALGRAALGRRAAFGGHETRVRIGPLPAARTREYEPGAMETRMEGPQGMYSRDLGPISAFERVWADWEAGRHTRDPECLPLTGRWPLLIYLLEHFLPANQSVRVDLLVDMHAPWRLTGEDEPASGTDHTRPAAKLGVGSVLAGGADG